MTKEGGPALTMASSCWPSVLCTHVPVPIILGPGIISLPFINVSSREASVFLYSIQPPACGISLIQRMLLISLVKWIVREEKERKKESKEGGTISSFGSQHPQFKGQMLENST